MLFVNNIFEEMFNVNQLKTDVIEMESKYQFKVFVPGVKKEDISINYENNYLSIMVNNKDNDEESNYVIKESCSGSYKRRFKINDIDSAAIKANLSDGVLVINVPKMEKTKEKYIEIE